MEREEDIGAVISRIIREGSAAGRLVEDREIPTELGEQGAPAFIGGERGRDLASTLARALRENEDLRMISGRKGVSYYYSDLSISKTYAKLLVGKLEDPLLLMAEIIREHSRAYPSPVPMAGFREPPFDLDEETILECLDEFERDEEYRDIARTTTSAGTTFLYSSRHLEPDYAVMLAEWMDVGQAENP